MSHLQDSQEDRASLVLTSTGPADTTADRFPRPPAWSTDLFLRCWLPQSCWEKAFRGVLLWVLILQQQLFKAFQNKQTKKKHLLLSFKEIINDAKQPHYWNNTWHAEYIQYMPWQYCPQLAEKPLWVGEAVNADRSTIKLNHYSIYNFSPQHFLKL